MFGTSSKYAAFSIRPYIAPLPRRQLVGLSSRYSNFSSVADNDNSPNRPDDDHKARSASDYEDEDPHIERYRRHRARTHKLDVDALGKPGQILVVPLKKRRRPGIERQNDGNSDDSSTNVTSPVSADLFGSNTSKENGNNDYVAYLEELRASYSPGDTVSREEYIELQDKIETGFTLNQLSKYYYSFPQRCIPTLSKGDTEVNSSNNDTNNDDEQWQAIASREASEDNKISSEKNSTSQKSKKTNKLRKEILTERIIRDCWQLEMHDEMGSLKINIPSQVISVILSSEQYSLEELAHSHNTKIEPFGSLNCIRVSGNRSACESVREIVKAYGAEIHTESFEQPLLNDKSWLIDGKQAKSRFLESIAQTLGIYINDPGRSSVAWAAYTVKDEDFMRVKRDLESANSAQSANEQVSFCADVPSSASGFMKRISTKRRQVMGLLERGKPWSRWAIPTSLQDYNEDSLPPLFSQHKPTLSSEILQVLREKSTKTGQHGLEEKLSATIGQCLFRTPSSLDSLTKINATQLGEHSFPRYFHGWLHPKGESLVRTRRIFPGDRTQIRLHRFRMTPCDPNNGKLPILEVEISVPWVNDPEAKFPFAGPELLSVKAIVEETSIDYLLPEVNYDIRFTRTLAREIFGVNGTEQPEALRNALLSPLNEVLSDPKEPFPPSCQVPVPAAMLHDILPDQALQNPSKNPDTIEGNYWFPGVQQALGTMIRTYEYSGERLCYSPNVKGSLNSKSDQLNLEMFVNSMPSYYARLQRRTNVDETLDPASDTLEQEFRAFYMTACQLAIELTQHSSRRSRADEGRFY
jgi:hypothetical protein